MFDRIAPRYDLLNRLFSLGRDVSWRKEVARHLPPGSALQVLDLATGTGDVLIALHRYSGRVDMGVGMDMAARMLELARNKITSRGLSERLALVVGDARRIPFGDGCFDAVTIAFGIRNVEPVRTGLSEMRRLLNTNGKVLILEFSLPGNRLLRALYLMYFRYVMPVLGAFISGDSYAYRYLNRTVETFPYGREFCRLMEEAGFRGVVAHPLTFGIATVYEGWKDTPPSEKGEARR
ncbi:MAG: bifunctional demethylmenaquinone methyltransferase/2-methoxy-6-polyprenyl-1,4-benzoquinol methylase UbiE [Candidatus Zixiibacteriota bacterium]|nr:MAG: bifunctional demethylmenaquinone methyltransferase/2-methoxy-6-polyprenyl-1,4-benzoquinol methylase UbiE [candidate division Zixibacteria bacterium]